MSLLWLVNPPTPIVHEGRKIIRIGFQAYTPKGVPVQTKEEKNAKARERYERNIAAERFRKTKAGRLSAVSGDSGGVREFEAACAIARGERQKVGA